MAELSFVQFPGSREFYSLAKKKDAPKCGGNANNISFVLNFV